MLLILRGVRSFVFIPEKESLIDAVSHPVLVFVGAEKLLFTGIGQKSAFTEHGGIAGVVKKIQVLAGFDGFPRLFGLNVGVEFILNGTGQFLAGRFIG